MDSCVQFEETDGKKVEETDGGEATRRHSGGRERDRLLTFFSLHIGHGGSSQGAEGGGEVCG